MTRRDPISSETERPHFYSQFWVDVAGGKRDLTPGQIDELEAEPELEEDEDFGAAIPEMNATRPAPKKPARERKPEPARPTITSLADLANIDLLMKNSAEMEGEEVPDLETGAMGDLEPFDSGEPPIVTDFEVDQAEEPAAETAESFGDEVDEDFADFDEEEEEDEWGSARKPSKQSKQNKRRERRPNF